MEPTGLDENLRLDDRWIAASQHVRAVRELFREIHSSLCRAINTDRLRLSGERAALRTSRLSRDVNGCRDTNQDFERFRAARVFGCWDQHARSGLRSQLG